MILHPTNGPEVHERAVLVIDVGGTNIKFGYVLAGQPHHFQRLFSTATMREGDPIAILAKMITAVVSDAGFRPTAIVTTVPGFIDKDADHILFAANIPGLNGRALATELSQLVGCDVFLERDAILALLGETLAGVARGADNVLGVFFGTGIGAAFVQEGRPFRGNGWALELGLMPFRGEGREFAGMRTDCLEAYASGRALQGVADRYQLPIDQVFLASSENSALSDQLSLFVRDQAFAVSSAVAMFSPAVIVLGGGVLDIEAYPRSTLVELIIKHAPISETGQAMDLRWAQHGWTSALMGAPLVLAERLARQRFSDSLLHPAD
jgi:predicted NBD/HSP70 family sugar kinase